MTKPFTRRQRKLNRLFRFFLKYWTFGVMPFFSEGSHLFPDDEDISLMLSDKYGKPKPDLGVTVQGGDHLPKQEIVVEQADRIHQIIRDFGGIETIRQVFDEYKSYNPQVYQTIKALSQKKQNETNEDLAERLNIEPQTLYTRSCAFFEKVIPDIDIRAHGVPQQKEEE